MTHFLLLFLILLLIPLIAMTDLEVSMDHMGTWTQLENPHRSVTSRVQVPPLKTTQDITWTKDSELQNSSALEK